MEQQAPALPSVVTEAMSLAVTDHESETKAATLLRDVVAHRKRVADHFRPLKQAADSAKRALLDAEKDALAPVERAEAILKSAIGDYRAEMQRRADEERRKQEAEARRKAEEERLRLAEEAERARKAAEEEAERARQAAEDAEDDFDPVAMAKANAEAEEAKRKAAEESARVDALLSAPVAVAPVRPAPMPQRQQGVSTREVWRAEVVDVLALCRYVSEHPEQASLVAPAMPVLNALAKAQKGALSIPGVRAVSETSVAVR